MIRLALTLVIGVAAVLVAPVHAPAEPESRRADCARTSVGLKALTELGRARYRGFRGGLYPVGRNRPSERYLRQGLAAARAVRPLDGNGAPSPDGRIALLSIGMSNTTQEFSVFKRLADADARKNPRVVLVDGAQGGQDAVRASNPSAPYWSAVEERLHAAGLTRAQVQAVWLKEAIARPTEPFPADGRRLQGALRAIVRIVRDRFPNLRLVYLSSRIYAGYAITPLNPEPHAYQSGFAVKWTIADRIEGKLRGPWLGWGPYLWADGTKPRRDGLVWSCADFRADGTHPSELGAHKVATLLFRFFTTEPTASTWFLA